MAEPRVEAYGPRNQAGETPPPPESGSLIEASAELVEAAFTYVRQETGDLVREKIVEPTQRAGVSAALAIAIALIAVTGVAFVSVGLLMVLADFVGWPGALLIIGGVLLIAAAVVAIVRSRRAKP